MHAVGDHQGLVAHPTQLADPFDLGVQPQGGIGALQRPLAEDADLFVQPATQPGDLVLAHVVQAELLDQPVDLAGGDPVDVGLLHHSDQGLLGAPARLQEAREVAALAEPGDGQFDLANPGLPGPRAIPVAVGEAVRGALTQLSADPCGDVALHEPGGHPGHRLAQHVSVLVGQQLVGQQLVGKLGSGHPGPLGHRGASFVDPWNRPTIMRPAVAELTSGPAALLHHDPRLDPTAPS
jgi:hypothetical protein